MHNRKFVAFYREPLFCIGYLRFSILLVLEKFLHINGTALYKWGWMECFHIIDGGSLMQQLVLAMFYLLNVYTVNGETYLSTKL